MYIILSLIISFLFTQNNPCKHPIFDLESKIGKYALTDEELEEISNIAFKVNDLLLKEGWKFPLMAKSSLGGYDGKGTKVINDYSELKHLLQTVNPKNWFIE